MHFRIQFFSISSPAFLMASPNLFDSPGFLLVRIFFESESGPRFEVCRVLGFTMQVCSKSEWGSRVNLNCIDVFAVLESGESK